MTVLAKDGQNLYDICIQTFGTMEELFTIIVDNPGFNVNTKLKASQEIIINNENVGNDEIKAFYLTNNIIPSNDQGTGNPPQEAGDFNFDFSNDFR